MAKCRPFHHAHQPPHQPYSTALLGHVQKPAPPGCSEVLPSRSGQEITPYLLNVDWHLAYRLTRVQQERNAVLLCDVPHSCHVIHLA